jgi:hypothetical protein
MFNSFDFHFLLFFRFLQSYTLFFFGYDFLDNSSGPSLLSFFIHWLHFLCLPSVYTSFYFLFPFLVISSFLVPGLPTSWCGRGVAQSKWRAAGVEAVVSPMAAKARTMVAPPLTRSATTSCGRWWTTAILPRRRPSAHTPTLRRQGPRAAFLELSPPPSWDFFDDN